MLRKCTIQVEGFGAVVAMPGPLFLEVLNGAGLELHNDCNGQGKCGKCRVVFAADAPEAHPADVRHLSAEEREAGVRLACFHQVRCDCAIAIPVPKGEGIELLDEI